MTEHTHTEEGVRGTLVKSAAELEAQLPGAETTDSVQFSSVQSLSCVPTLCDSMNRSTPVPPVHQQLPESTQTHVHRINDATQPSHPLSSPSPPTLSLSQNQGLFK